MIQEEINIIDSEVYGNREDNECILGVGVGREMYINVQDSWLLIYIMHGLEKEGLYRCTKLRT